MQPTKEIKERKLDETTRLIEEERRRENFKQFTRAKLHKGKNQRKLRKRARLVRGN